ncbi:MAG: hypothetical protein R3D26_12930 [Cyanobacteriota/Melainabacteria group bacterium]
MISRLLSGYDSGLPAWKFIQEHFQYIKDYYPPISARKMLAQLANLERTETADQIRTIFASNRFPGGDLAVASLRALRLICASARSAVLAWIDTSRI